MPHSEDDQRLGRNEGLDGRHALLALSSGNGAPLLDFVRGLAVRGRPEGDALELQHAALLHHNEIVGRVERKVEVEEIVDDRRDERIAPLQSFQIGVHRQQSMREAADLRIAVAQVLQMQEELSMAGEITRAKVEKGALEQRLQDGTSVSW